MKKYGKKGFTLIELIAVLVIMAIIALIVTPLVMSIIRKARVSADKRSIDAYGRSIELAIAGYLLDNGKFPTEVSQLTIEYSGSQVECSTTQINSDSSVYLAGCTVAGRSVGDYTYGEEEVITYNSYEVGDEVTYNNINYYVIKDSSASEESVTLLKAEPLSVAEVNEYGAGHVNRYASSSAGTASNQNGYGGMAYYMSSSCSAYGNHSNCRTDYESSEIKYIVDAWALSKVPNGLVEARLLTLDELTENLGYEINQLCSAGDCQTNVSDENKLSWVYNSNYSYWTMTTVAEYSNCVWNVDSDGKLRGYRDNNAGGSWVHESEKVVRPVIILKKSVL